MEQNDLAYDAVAKEDVQRLRAQLQAVPVFAQQPGMGMGGSAVVDVTRTQFFRIPFTQVQQQQRQRLGLGLVADTEKRGARRQREMCHHSTHSTIQYSHPSPPPNPQAHSTPHTHPHPYKPPFPPPGPRPGGPPASLPRAGPRLRSRRAPRLHHRRALPRHPLPGPPRRLLLLPLHPGRHAVSSRAEPAV